MCSEVTPWIQHVGDVRVERLMSCFKVSNGDLNSAVRNLAMIDYLYFMAMIDYLYFKTQRY